MSRWMIDQKIIFLSVALIVKKKDGEYTLRWKEEKPTDAFYFGLRSNSTFWEIQPPSGANKKQHSVYLFL